MEFNKIFAAILIAGIIAMFSGFIAEQLTHPHDLEENAYKIEGVEAASVGGAEKLAEPILAMLSEADLERGQKLSKACAACHTFDKGGADGVGPHLWDVVGRNKQSVSGFSYSGALNQNGEEVWTYAALNKFLWNPKKYAPGTKMNYIGLKKPEDRAAMVAWLRTLADSPKPMPGAAAIASEQAELAPAEPEVSDEQDQTDKENLTEAIETLQKGDAGNVTGSLEDANMQDAADTVQESVNKAEENAE